MQALMRIFIYLGWEIHKNPCHDLGMLALSFMVNKTLLAIDLNVNGIEDPLLYAIKHLYLLLANSPGIPIDVGYY